MESLGTLGGQVERDRGQITNAETKITTTIMVGGDVLQRVQSKQELKQ